MKLIISIEINIFKCLSIYYKPNLYYIYIIYLYYKPNLNLNVSILLKNCEYHFQNLFKYLQSSLIKI